MLTTVHLLTGAALGKLTGNWLGATVLSYALHHLLDSIPHFNPSPVKGYLEGHIKGADIRDLFLKSLEPVLAIIGTLYLIFWNPSEIRIYMIFGAIFSWLPDLFVFIDWKFNKPWVKFFTKIEKRFHRHTRFLPGVISQILISALALFILLK
ncbi:MAG TPA: hypothetical protein VJH71_01075 [Candidatus Paceibacterota bacterium]